MWIKWQNALKSDSYPEHTLIIFKQWQFCGYSWAFSDNVYEQLSNNIGDFLWGTIGIIFTFTATLFLFITFREQRTTSRNQRAK